MSTPPPTSTLLTAGSRATWRELGALLRHHIRSLLLATVTLAASATVALVGPWLLGRLVDAIGTEEGAAALVPIVLALTAAAVVSGVLAAFARGAVARIGERLLAELRRRIFDHVLRLRQHQIEAIGRGELLGRLSGDSRVVGDAVSSVLPGFAQAAWAIGATAFGLGLLDWRFVLGAALAVPIQVLALRWFLRRSQPVYRAARAAAGQRSQVMLETFDAWQTVFAHGLGARREARIDEAARAARDQEVRAIRLGVRFWGTLHAAEFTGMAAVLAVGWLLVRDADVTVGQATTAALYFLSLFGPIGQLLAGFDTLQQAAAGLSRLVGILEIRVDAAAERPPAERGGVELREVSVRYGAGAPTAVAGVSLSVAAGETVAIVGPSGAGKSTVAAVMAGLVVPESGGVRLGAGAGTGAGAGSSAGAGAGVSAGSSAGAGTVAGAGAGVSAGAGAGTGTDAGTGAGTGVGAGTGTRAGAGAGVGTDHGAGAGAGTGAETATAAGTQPQLALISQETHVFTGTLAENLLLARPGSSSEELGAALEAVGASEWVARLPAGLDTPLGEGAHPLSPIQAQQLALARVWLLAPPIIVMDEATAEAGSADTRLLDQAVDRLTDGRTAVLIAHRLDQAVGADRILVMSGGRIVEEGTHGALLERDGAYAELWRAWTADSSVETVEHG